MRLAFISDIHGNLKALEKALKIIKADEIYCLGDIVDRGPDSNGCIELVRKHCNATILGNHDFFAATHGHAELDVPKIQPDRSKGEHLNPEIYKEILTDENQKYLQSCCSELEIGDIFLAHTLHDHANPWFYVLDENSAFYGFGLLKKKIAAIGHAHMPVIFEEKRLNETEFLITKHELKRSELILDIKENRRYIIGVGSIGMGDTVGEYGIIDGKRIEIHRFRI